MEIRRSGNGNRVVMGTGDGNRVEIWQGSVWMGYQWE